MCMIDSGDDYGWTPLGESSRRARKAHRCCECDRTIDAGETYWVGAAATDGSVDSWKTCAHCHAGPCAWLVKHCRGYLIHGVEEDMQQHWDYGDLRGGAAKLEVGRLIVGMGRKWKRVDGSLMRIPVGERSVGHDA